MGTSRITIEETIIMAPCEFGGHLRQRAMTKFIDKLKSRRDIVNIVSTHMDCEFPDVLRVTGNISYKSAALVDVFKVSINDVIEMAIYDITPDGIFCGIHQVKAILPIIKLETHGGYVHAQNKAFTLYGRVYGLNDTIDVVIRKMMHCSGEIIKVVVDVNVK